MAWYKWLDENMYDPIWEIQWPQIGEVKNIREVSNEYRGFHVYSGSRVASYIPSRHTPIDLYQVEVDGEYTIEDGQVYFNEVTPIEKKGTLQQDAASKVALAWLDLIIELQFNDPFVEHSWNKSQIEHARNLIAAKLDGQQIEDVMAKARMSGERSVVYAASSAVAKTPDQAWSFAINLTDEARHPKLGLEFARVLERSMNGEL